MRIHSVRRQEEGFREDHPVRRRLDGKRASAGQAGAKLGRFSGCSAYLRRIGRADERTRTADLLITSVRSAVAEGCTGLQILHR
jgi:hypothetical protein